MPQHIKALGHLELETTTSPDSPLDLMERLIALSNYLIKAGPVIKDGETVGASARERIAVRIGPSKLGGPGDVMHLEWAPPGAKPWWRFWD